MTYKDKIQIGDATLYLGDCLDILPTLDKVDCVVTDPPYGTTKNEWDNKLNLEILWNHFKSICKNNCAYIFTASQPFTTDLINSNRAWFKYEWIWDKINRYSNFLDSNIKPMKRHENIIIFYDNQPIFNKQCGTGKPYKAKRSGKLYEGFGEYSNINGENFGSRNPYSIIHIKADKKDNKHPSQKPVELMEYLSLTYTNEQETILDPFMGSGTTGVAALKLGRKFIGIEIDETYFKIAVERISKEANQLKMF